MKLGELNMHCGECSIIEMCGEPHSTVSPCTREALEDMTEDEYGKLYDALMHKGESEGLFSSADIEEINAEIEQMICEKQAR